MTRVSLEGRLGKIIGRSFKFKTRTLKETLSAIEANTGYLMTFLKSNRKRVFAIFVDGKEVKINSECNLIVKDKHVQIIPLLYGNIVITTKFIVVSVLGISAEAAVAYAVATFIVSAVLMTAISFGISMIVASIMKEDDPELINTSSFVFTSAENVTRQGIPVAVGYGRMLIGSRVLSASLVAVDKGQSFVKLPSSENNSNVNLMQDLYSFDTVFSNQGLMQSI